MSEQGYSIAVFADRAGLSVNTLKGYRRRKMLPKADVRIIGLTGEIEREGWHLETIDNWIATRPGRGNRFYTTD